MRRAIRRHAPPIGTSAVEEFREPRDHTIGSVLGQEVPGTRDDIECGAWDRPVQSLRERARVERIVSAPEDGRGDLERRESWAECAGGVVVEANEMCDERVATGGGGEGLESGVEREPRALRNREAADDRSVYEASEQCRRQPTRDGAEKSGQARESIESSWRDTERGSVEEGEMRDACRCLEGDGLRHGTTESVPDEGGVIDAEVIEQREDRRGERRAVWGRVGFGSSVAGQVADDEPVRLREVARDRVPEPAGDGEPVKEHHRDSSPAGARGVVVEAPAPDIDELTSHCGESGAFVIKWYPLAFPRGTSGTAAPHPVD